VRSPILQLSLDVLTTSVDEVIGASRELL